MSKFSTYLLSDLFIKNIVGVVETGVARRLIWTLHGLVGVAGVVVQVHLKEIIVLNICHRRSYEA